MSKKILVFIPLLLLSLSMFSPAVSATVVTIPDQDHMIMESIGDPETVDPAWAYDTASAMLIFNVYDTLIFFDHERVDKFEYSLATEYSINQPPDPAAPPGTNSTWYFKIRGCPATAEEPAVKFHDGSTLTTEDVEYSFERAMVQDRSGGPVWMLNEPLFGNGWPDKSGWPEDDSCPINLAVQRNSTHVWFNLAMPYPPFMQILSQSWASIVNKAFCIAHGDWPGTWTNWKAYEDPAHSPLDSPDNVMCGTGPYMGPPFSDPDIGTAYWTHGVEWSIVRFKDYWQGWPAPHCPSYVNRWTEKVVYEWETRYSDFIGGYADLIYVPRAYLPKMILNWPEKWPDYTEQYAEGIRCIPGLPSLASAAFFFNMKIDPTSGYIGSGSFPDGIPTDFFNDTRIRKAFAYCMDYGTFIDEIFWGEAEQPSSCVIDGIRYHNPDNPKYNLNLTKAAELFQEASADPSSPAYGVWNTGFAMTLLYNTGNVPRETTATMIKTNVEKVFESAPGTASITIQAVPWPTYLGELVHKTLTMFIIGWLADYPDPHNWVVPFMYTYGDFTYFQSYSNSTVDALIEQGIVTPDGPEREAIYYKLQLMYYQDCPSVCTSQALGRHWERDWVQGWYYNPIYPGNYAYHLWKGLNGDVNGDNSVDTLDNGVVSGHWYPGPPVGPAGYDRIADISPELQYPLQGVVDIFDAAEVSSHFGETVG